MKIGIFQIVNWPASTWTMMSLAKNENSLNKSDTRVNLQRCNVKEPVGDAVCKNQVSN